MSTGIHSEPYLQRNGRKMENKLNTNWSHRRILKCSGKVESTLSANWSYRRILKCSRKMKNTLSANWSLQQKHEGCSTIKSIREWKVNKLHKQELGLNDYPSVSTRSRRAPGKNSGAQGRRRLKGDCGNGQKCRYKKNKICKLDHTTIQSCHKYLFKHKGSKGFSYSKESHSTDNQEVWHFDENSVYTIFGSGQEDYATSEAFASATIPTHCPSPSLD